MRTGQSSLVFNNESIPGSHEQDVAPCETQQRDTRGFDSHPTNI